MARDLFEMSVSLEAVLVYTLFFLVILIMFFFCVLVAIREDPVAKRAFSCNFHRSFFLGWVFMDRV